jgi:hypothetical protein
MFETIAAMGAAKIVTYVIGSVIAFILAFLMKSTPNDKIYGWVEEKSHSLGKLLTLTASKKSKLWNLTIEAWLIDLFRNTVLAFLNGFIRGLKSDNKESGNSKPT